MVETVNRHNNHYQGIVWTNPQHGLVRTAARVDSFGVLHPTFGPLFFMQASFSYALTVGGLVLFVRDYTPGHNSVNSTVA